MADKQNSIELNSVITEATRHYFESCRARIPGFIHRHFQYPGAWHTNRVALGLDIVRAPLNLFWAPVYALISFIKYLLHRKGYLSLASLLGKVPDGATTQVQKHLAKLIYSDLLQLDCEQSSLEVHIAAALEERYNESHPSINQQKIFAQRIGPLVHQALLQYRITRTASSDITNSIASTLVGAFAFHKFTPGGIGIGLILAAIIAKATAVNEFFLGRNIGYFYYALLPPEPSLELKAWSLLAVLAVLSAFASFSGLITDPLQSVTRLHHQRLHKMINHLEKDFLEEANNSFRPKDQYVARILDMFDVIKPHL
ncbi:DUF6635 family protein [Teredinibacter haidensis]|uniref:DUF6635 family protein n=1 Tax=Teredinibacter haidensis TaxID=2731755 RepID=UPI000948B16F|nr:DUF6635 family protein [Teredinibacter haidensis]